MDSSGDLVMPERYYVVIVDADGCSQAVRISPRDYDEGRRTLAAASILAGEPVDTCVTVETNGKDRLAFADVPVGLGRSSIRRSAVASAIGHCVRQITGDETDRYLAQPRNITSSRSRGKRPVQLDLFRASE